MTGEQARRSICDDIGARLDCSTAMKVLCGLWLIPSVALTWIGFVSMGIRDTAPEVTLHSLEKVQAMSVLLAIFTLVVAAMWAIRVGDHLPEYRRTIGRRSEEARFVHFSFGVITIATFTTAKLTDGTGPWFTIAAWSAFLFFVGLLRPISAAPVVRPYTLTAFAAACLFQLTVGWLHLLDPAGEFAITTVAQGLVLAWTATASVREVAGAQRAVRFGRAVDSTNREQVRRPLAEPAVGH